jgi:leucyl/phenylalanyl-tRNA--protein transferase
MDRRTGESGGDSMASRTDSAAPAAQEKRRAALFRESAGDQIERWALGTAWALHPSRIGNLPALARLWAKDLVRRQGRQARQDGLPDPEQTLNRAGLVGIAHDISVPTLVRAYRNGLFTHAHFGPLKWYSLDERCVLFFNEFHIAKSLRRQMRKGQYTVTFDRDFEGVIKACAGRREGKWHVTWITPRIMRAYAAMFDAGHVHSFEVWNADGALVGGGYGVAIGRIFFTESQFSHEANTSKIGFTVLNWHLARWGYALNDGKWPTPTIANMGFRMIPRAEFRLRIAAAAFEDGKAGRWQVETDLKTVADWQPGESAPPATRTTAA